MENQVLSIERMKHLQELGVDTSKASMCWLKDITKEIAEEKEIDMTIGWSLDFNNPEFYKFEWMKGIPTFTLQDILELLPNVIVYNNTNFKLCIERSGQNWCLYYYAYDTTELISIDSLYLLDAAYEMLCWCIEHGYIKSK